MPFDYSISGLRGDRQRLPDPRKEKLAREMSHERQAQTPGNMAYALRARDQVADDVADAWNTKLPGSKATMNYISEQAPWTPLTAPAKLASKAFDEGVSVGDTLALLPGVGEVNDAVNYANALRTGDKTQGTIAAASLALPFVGTSALKSLAADGAITLSDALRVASL